MTKQPNTQRAKWEYHVSEVATNSPGNLNVAELNANAMGADGWELVAVHGDDMASKAHLWFKRRVA